MNRSQKRQEAFSKVRSTQNKAIRATVAQDNPYLVDTTEYIAAKITGASSNFRITQTDGKLKVGLQSFSGDALTAGEHMVIDCIKIEYANHIQSDNVKVGGAAYRKAAPAELMNAELVIKHDSAEVLRMPVSDIHNPNATNSNADKYRELGHLPILEADRAFEISLEYPDGVAMKQAATADDHFIRIEWRGFKLKK